MKQKMHYIGGPTRATIGALALAVLFAFGAPQAALAAGTSGGATIYNTVKVTYVSGSLTAFATANSTLTVNTLAAAPSVTVPTNQSGVSSDTFTYQYALKSNANGPDTYTTSNLLNTANGVGAATSPSITASVALWGGIALGSPADGTITVPFGTTGGLVATTSVVQIGADQYTVTTITAGSAASTDGNGDLVAEVADTLTLTPVGTAPAIVAGAIAGGTQVGQVLNITVQFDAGSPTATGTDGTYATTFDVSSTLAPVGTTNVIGAITTIFSPSLSITKTANPAANVDPGGTITYTLVVTNNSPTATASSVTVIDPVPAYTTYVASSTTRDAGAVADPAAGVSPLEGAGLSIGNLAPSTSTTIIYQVTVQ